MTVTDTSSAKDVAHADKSRRRVVVCIPTFNRPQGLRDCLESVRRQVFPDNADVSISVIVADNGDGTAAESINRNASSSRFPIRGIHVSTRGLCHARNTLFAEARGQGDYLALIDDDEEASPGWLWSLIQTAETFDADAVIGPVAAQYEAATPLWYLKSGMEHLSPRLMKLATGAPSPKRAAHNALIRASVVEGMASPWFPLALNFAGSEDRAFFDSARAAGFGRVIWCAEAWVGEKVPLSRTTRQFFVKRNLQRGSSEVLAEDLCRQLPGESDLVVWKGYARTIAVLVKAALLSPCLLSPVYRFRCLRVLFYGVGRLKGHMGSKQELYK